jgi:hypothetical protein
MGGWQRMELDDIPSNQYLILDNTSFANIGIARRF